MRKPLNWMLSGAVAGKATTGGLRSRLAATTILAVVPLLGYGRQAYAVCTPSPSPILICSGTGPNGVVNDDTNAEVRTAAPTWTVTDEGVVVRGEGHIQFIDNNASSINNNDGNALTVKAYDGLEGGPEGNITITTNGTLTGNQGDLTDQANGIYARNYGSGDTTITVTGNVSGTEMDPYDPEADIAADGIFARNEGRNLTITTGVGSNVNGSDNGIDAFNAHNYSEDANGDLIINANGIVNGQVNDGIHAENYGYNLTINTGTESVITGGGHGIGALNFGEGDLTIDAEGDVASYSEGTDGIHAVNVSGEYQREDNEDWTFGRGRNLFITTGSASTVIGVDDGIEARNFGTGDLEVDAGGLVTGEGGFGIRALQDTWSTEDEVSIKVGAAGTVQGNEGGIGVRTYGNYISIYNAGMIRNLSGASQDLAITTNTDYEDYPYGYLDSADTFVDNRANLIGQVRFEATYGKDTVDNSGFWNMAGGDSDFGGNPDYCYGDNFCGDEVINSGVLVAADDSSAAETSRIFNLERFTNNGGLISLLDGDHNDTLLLTNEPPPDIFVSLDATPSLEYIGNNGKLAVDANLGKASNPATDHLSDELIVRGTTSGTTIVSVNVVGASGANTEGIPVIRVEGGPGSSGPGQFELDGPVNAGFFTWDMRYDADNNWHELYTVTSNPDDPNNPGAPVLGPGALEFPQGFAATQDIWFQTVGTLLHRQADLRSLLQNVAVTPVADYSEPVEPTPVAAAIMAPGFWFKGFGTYIDRDDEQNGYDLDQKQTIYGGMAGFDFGTREAFGDAWLFGVFGGYIGSNLEFKETNTQWKYQGPTVGAYVTYLDQAFYADATIKVDFLNIDVEPDDLGGSDDDSSTDAINFGGRIDTGYKFGHEAFIEPQASLAVVQTEVDDLDIYGGKVEFDDDTSVRGRLGLRVGVEYADAGATVYSTDLTGSVWQNFTGDNSDVTIADTGLPDFGVAGDQGSTFGDISLGLSAANPDGWSSFLRGNYIFADDYEAWTGNAGVRFAW
ncbi:MAG: autotransporter outer membrane beta-barrel domain-containing protein [Parvibaculaceae bacterium]